MLYELNDEQVDYLRSDLIDGNTIEKSLRKALDNPVNDQYVDATTFRALANSASDWASQADRYRTRLNEYAQAILNTQGGLDI